MTRPKKELCLILGGARSGKSAFAQRLARQKGHRVLFVATAQAGDSEMRQRIRRHQRSRSATWRTLEEPLDVSERISRLVGTGSSAEVVLIDCLTLWVSNLLLATIGKKRKLSASAVRRATQEIERRVQSLLRAYDDASASFIIVSNEVGMGIVPDNPLARAYRDALGLANQLLAARADRVYLLVAGIPVEVKGLEIISQPSPSILPLPCQGRGREKRNLGDTPRPPPERVKPPLDSPRSDF